MRPAQCAHIPLPAAFRRRGYSTITGTVCWGLESGKAEMHKFRYRCRQVKRGISRDRYEKSGANSHISA